MKNADLAVLLELGHGVWPSSENWHLYYKLRRAYGDQRLLHQAPGHLFFEHEAEDLTSFLQVAILNGWGGCVLTHANYVNAFFSRDEYIDFFADNLDVFVPVCWSLWKRGVEPLPA